MMAGIGALIFVICVLYKYDPRGLKAILMFIVSVIIIGIFKN